MFPKMQCTGTLFNFALIIVMYVRTTSSVLCGSNMNFIGLIFHLICAGLLEKMRGKGGKWVKGAGGLEHIGGSEGLDGQMGHWETIMRI